MHALAVADISLSHENLGEVFQYRAEAKRSRGGGLIYKLLFADGSTSYDDDGYWVSPFVYGIERINVLCTYTMMIMMTHKKDLVMAARPGAD